MSKNVIPHCVSTLKYKTQRQENGKIDKLSTVKK